MTKNNDREKTGRILLELATERDVQVERGYDTDHDDARGVGHLAGEACIRIDQGFEMSDDESGLVPSVESETRRTLVQAAALLVAAIEVYDRSLGGSLGNL